MPQAKAENRSCHQSDERLEASRNKPRREALNVPSKDVKACIHDLYRENRELRSLIQDLEARLSVLEGYQGREELKPSVAVRKV